MEYRKQKTDSTESRPLISYHIHFKEEIIWGETDSFNAEPRCTILKSTECLEGLYIVAGGA